MERLQKVMAAAGVGSRRACEEMIKAGRVRVDGKTVTLLGTKVDPLTAHITVNERPLQREETAIYVKLHKPRGMLSDFGGDARDRRTVLELLPKDIGRVFPVGRLDQQSEGLMLLTNDGELAHRLTHPRFEHPKIYFVLLERHPPLPAIEALRRGVQLPDGHRTAAPAQVQVVEKLPKRLKPGPGPMSGCWLEIVLREGKKRQIRHMTAAVGHPTLRLIRWSIGPLTLKDLPIRTCENLTRKEITALRQIAQQRVKMRKRRDGG